MTIAEFDVSYFDEHNFYTPLPTTETDTVTASDIGPVQLQVSPGDVITMPEVPRSRIRPEAWAEALDLVDSLVPTIIPAAVLESIALSELVTAFHSATILEALACSDCNTLYFDSGYFDALYFDAPCEPDITSKLYANPILESLALPESPIFVLIPPVWEEALAVSDAVTWHLCGSSLDALSYTEIITGQYGHIELDSAAILDCSLTSAYFDVGYFDEMYFDVSVCESLATTELHKTVPEDITISDTIGTPLYRKVILENLAVSELEKFELADIIAESVSLGEEILPVYLQTVPEALDLNDIWTWHLVEVSIDTIVMSDTLRPLYLVRSSDILAVPDQDLNQLQMQVLETLGIADIGQVYVTIFITDNLDIAETIRSSIQSIQSDGISFDELISRIVPVFITDSIALPDQNTYFISYTVRDNLLVTSIIESDFHKILVLTSHITDDIELTNYIGGTQTFDSTIIGSLILDGVILK